MSIRIKTTALALASALAVAAGAATAQQQAAAPAQQAQGELACNGITDEVLRQTCILDVGLTGETAFVQAAEEIAAVRANHGQLDPIANSATQVTIPPIDPNLRPVARRRGL